MTDIKAKPCPIGSHHVKIVRRGTTIRIEIACDSLYEAQVLGEDMTDRLNTKGLSITFAGPGKKVL